MTKPFLRLVVLVFLGGWMLPLVTLFCTRWHFSSISQAFLIELSLITLAGGLATFLLSRFLSRWESGIDAGAREQARFLDTFSDRYVSLAIVGAAALSLFLELAVIRWQATVFESFAFYKNFGLLSCFAGLGLGYALAKRDRILLHFTIPLLAWQCALMIGLRFGLAPEDLRSLNGLPFLEQFSMGIGLARKMEQRIAIYFLFSVIFLSTALAFIPVGQLCGRLMERREKLRAYGLNLLGSLAGVILMFVAGWLWTPPLVWYAACFLMILLFYSRRRLSLTLGIGCAVAAALILVWPVVPWWERIYSPYQLLEVRREDNGSMMLRAAGHYYQRVHDFSDPEGRTSPALKRIRSYYDLPYQVHPGHEDIAVVGAGTGNDVAAALRAGGQRVDAIEIDPAILELGRAYHPEEPYGDPRVRSVVTDARSFLRTTNRKYDLIVYGLLDSHTLLSHASSVRLDSFVYTLEGLREAKGRLKEDGVIALSFSVINYPIGVKIYRMIEEAFDGHGPVCVQADYDGAVVFL